MGPTQQMVGISAQAMTRVLCVCVSVWIVSRGWWGRFLIWGMAYIPGSFRPILILHYALDGVIERVAPVIDAAATDYIAK